MYCRNCANPIDSNAVFCVKCGIARGQGQSFCPNCGQPVAMPGAAGCIHCGVAFGVPVLMNNQKSKIAAGLLGIFLGSFGVHNFYLGFTGKAVAQLLISLLSCGLLAAVSSVWGLIEGILILSGSIAVDARGIPLKD